MPQTASLGIAGVNKAFDSIVAVRDVSFEANTGEILGLLGPNGAGKTTTIRMIMGIMQPDSGSIRYAFADTGAARLKERVGYLPEERGLYSDAKVHDLLAYFGELKGMKRSAARSAASEWIDRMDLGDWAKKKIDKLSKGMQQKVQFAAAVLHAPDLVILDEPFSGLDPLHQDLIKDFIRNLRTEGMTVLLSSHQMNRVEELCDRIFLIHRGQRVLYGALHGIKESFGDHFVSLDCSGDSSGIAQLPGVAEFKQEENRITLVLRSGHEPDAFVRALPETVEIRALHVDRPPLHEIFVQTIEGEIDETT